MNMVSDNILRNYGSPQENNFELSGFEAEVVCDSEMRYVLHLALLSIPPQLLQRRTIFNTGQAVVTIASSATSTLTPERAAPGTVTGKCRLSDLAPCIHTDTCHALYGKTSRHSIL